MQKFDLEETARRTTEVLRQSKEEHDQEMLRRHEEIVNELRNLVQAVKELTELIRNTR